MTRTLVIVSSLALTLGCASSPRRPAPVDGSPTATVPMRRPVSPPLSREADPDNTERRFGFEESRARREAAREQPQGDVEVLDDATRTKPAAKPASAPVAPPVDAQPASAPVTPPQSSP